MIVLYIVDHEGLCFSGQKYHTKISLTIPSWCLAVLVSYHNEIAISDHYDHVVKKFTLQGDYLSKFGSYGSGDYQSRHTTVCRAAQETGAQPREYIDRKKENAIFAPP